jgi:hypothetical protein
VKKFQTTQKQIKDIFKIYNLIKTISYCHKMNSWKNNFPFLCFTPFFSFTDTFKAQKENFFNFPMKINLILHAEWMLICLLGLLMPVLDISCVDVEPGLRHISHEKRIRSTKAPEWYDNLKFIVQQFIPDFSETFLSQSIKCERKLNSFVVRWHSFCCRRSTFMYSSPPSDASSQDENLLSNNFCYCYETRNHLFMIQEIAYL